MERDYSQLPHAVKSQRRLFYALSEDFFKMKKTRTKDTLTYLHPFLNLFKAFSVSGRNYEGNHNTEVLRKKLVYSNLNGGSIEFILRSRYIPKDEFRKFDLMKNNFNDLGKTHFFFDIIAPKEEKVREIYFENNDYYRGKGMCRDGIVEMPVRSKRGGNHTPFINWKWGIDFMIARFLEGDKGKAIAYANGEEFPKIEVKEEDGELTKLVDTVIPILFAGNEREQLQKKIEQAKLQMRGCWASVPKLNLGTIKIPAPGQRDINTDAFVTEATPYFIEYISSLGVMSASEAEELAEQKLINYFVHKGGFQLNRENATRIVSGLRKDNNKKLEVA